MMRKAVGRTSLGVKILGLRYLFNIQNEILRMQLVSLKFAVYVQVIYTNVEGCQSIGSL